MEIFPDPLIEYDFENVYRPSDDTYLIIDYLRYHVDTTYFDGLPLENVSHILDMGTGTGYVALFLLILKQKLEKFNPKVYASDILPEAIRLAKTNEALNKFSGQIKFLTSDLFTSFPPELKHQFDVIIFNPPYLPSSKQILTKRKIDFSWEGGEKGFEVFLSFLDQVRVFINPQRRSYLYYITSTRLDLETFYSLVQEKDFENTVLEKRHVFMEDILLNRIIME